MNIQRRAFTLIEMLITAAIVGVMAGLAVDMFGGSRYEQVDAGVRLLEADLGYARSVALSTPADPVLLRIAVNGGSYHLAHASAPDTVLTGPNGPLRTTFGSGKAEVAAGVVITSSASRDITFGPFGGVMDPVPTVYVSNTDGPERARVVLDPFTGDLTVTYQSH